MEGLNLKKVIMFLANLRLITGMVVSFSSFDPLAESTTTQAPETISAASLTDCPIFEPSYEGNQLTLEIIPGQCLLVIQPHDQTLIRNLSSMFGKKMKKMSRKLQYPDISFVYIGEPIEGDIGIPCEMPYRHKGPFLVVDTSENCQMVIGVQRQRMSKVDRSKLKMERKEQKAKLSKAERKQMRKTRRQNARRTRFMPVVQYVSGRML